MPRRRAARSAAWAPPSRRVRELIRKGAAAVLEAPPEWLEEIDAATLGAPGLEAVAEDPVLASAMRRSNRANLAHWAHANVRNPGAPVEPNLGPEPLTIARDLVRRGFDESALHTYRTGQNAAWLRWMQIAFELTRDPSELRELLDVTARSITSYLDATVVAVAERMRVERSELTRGTHAERREVVSLILEGAPISAAQASRRLGYDLERAHRAAVVWSDAAESDLGALESAADALARAVKSAPPLVVIASAATLWVWLPSEREADLASLRSAPSVHVAVGSLGRGIEGFRRSHLDALTAQRFVARLSARPPVVTFDEVRLVALVAQDPEGAEQLVKHALGRLQHAAPELRQALLAFLREGCNASSTARRLRAHRNTLLRRLATAQELLPRPLAENRIEVGVALEILRWREDARR